MSAANLFCLPDRACLLTDAASYAGDGTVVLLESKVAVSHRHRTALSTSGSGWAGLKNEIAAWMDAQPSQSAVLTAVPAYVADLDAELKRNAVLPIACHPYQTLQVYIAIWHDQRDQPETYVLAGPGSTFGPDYPVGTLAGVAEIVSPPVDRALWLRPNFDPRRNGIALMEAQRAHLDDGGASRVGGWAELTEVTREGVVREILHTWPDQTGHRINISRSPYREARGVRRRLSVLFNSQCRTI